MIDGFDALWQSLGAQGSTVSAYLQDQIVQFECSDACFLQKSLLNAVLARKLQDSSCAFRILLDVQGQVSSQIHQFPSHISALFYHELGLLQREHGQFCEAATSFIKAFEYHGSHIKSIHALQFTRVDEQSLELLVPLLQSVLVNCEAPQPLALQLLADWQFQLGEKQSSCCMSYHASKLAVGTRYHDRLDHLSSPTLPEALIIGAPKSGTTSLAAWLSGHNQIYVHPRKELHFFDARWDRGLDWYRCQFPCFTTHGLPIIRLEATPNYLQFPGVPERVHASMPWTKIIVILRDPCERALSWCHHIIRQEGVSLSPEEVITQELDFLEGLDEQAILEVGWHKTNCVIGSLYTIQLKRWSDLFLANQLLLLSMDSIVRDPDSAWRKLCEFLEVNSGHLDRSVLRALPVLNSAPCAYPDLSQSLLERMAIYLRQQSSFVRQLA